MSRRARLALVGVLASLLVGVAGPAAGEDLRVVAWNVESGSGSQDDPHNGNDPGGIAQQLANLERYHIYALTEVHSSNIQRYRDAIDGAHVQDYDEAHTDSGGGDRMMIVWDTSRLEIQGAAEELERHDGHRLNFRNSSGRLRFRSPFVARFLDKETGITFLFMVNHLARGDSSARREQARGLREWARDQTEPVITAGDFNFDFSFRQGVDQGNSAFQQFLVDDVWIWVEPEEFIDTNWADRRQGGVIVNPREDRFPDTILDFVFIAGGARGWLAESEVVVQAGDFPDSGDTSDHRPVEATLSPLGLATSPLLDSIEAMRERIAALEELLDELRHELDEMEAQIPPP